jgi:hypothetical protein
MRVSSGRWLSLILVLVAVGILCLRILWPRFTNPEARPTISDLSLSSPLNQPGGGEISAEAYEIYSALYQQPSQEALAFVEDSKTDIPQVNGSCLKPSTPEEHEMTDAFVASNRQSHRWERKFTIPAGYQLLPGSGTAKVEDCIAGSGKSSADCEAYRSLRHLRFLGAPGVDHAHTRALVSVIKVCGNQCGSGGIFEVEKTGNTWKRSEMTDFFRDCSWMY